MASLRIQVHRQAADLEATPEAVQAVDRTITGGAIGGLGSTNHLTMKNNSINEISVGGAYVSPAVDVIDIMAEGVLCQSGQFEEWQEEEL